MFTDISLLEWIGYLASIVVAVSLMMVSILKLRWLNLLGSSIFSFYGFAIGAYPVGILNLFIAIVNVYYLRVIYSKKDAFKIISIKDDSPYLRYFLNFYRQEIIRFFPAGNEIIEKILAGRENSINLIILRNAAVSGIFTGQKFDDCIKVDLDFVIPEYRDLKPGQFLFGAAHDTFKQLSVKRIQSKSFSPKHLQYLKRIGFVNREMVSGEVFFQKEIA
ncbi:MAG TPA: hypothetical protein VLH61_06805 [Bacteroidales bacterium]|nr:hypothetical protein [Bacteroidales bacterium]